MSDLREALGDAAGPPPPPLDVRAVQDRVAQRSHRRRILAAAAVALPAVGLGAVIVLGAGPDPRGGDVLVPAPPAESTPQTAAPSVQPTAPAPPTALPTAVPSSPEAQPSQPRVRYAAPPAELAYDSGDAAFRTPSGNIFCYLTSGQAACAIGERNWTPPPRPDDCDEMNDYAEAVSVETGPATFSCGTDTPVDPDAPVLAYGQGWVVDAWRCASERTGVTCENTETGHGFTLSRETYRVF